MLAISEDVSVSNPMCSYGSRPKSCSNSDVVRVVLHDFSCLHLPAVVMSSHRGKSQSHSMYSMNENIPTRLN